MFDDTGPEAACDLRSPVGRTGVNDDDLLDDPGDRAQTVAYELRLITDDQGRGEQRPHLRQLLPVVVLALPVVVLALVVLHLVTERLIAAEL